MKILFFANECHPGTQGGIQTFGRALKKMFTKELLFLSLKTSNKKVFNVKDVIEILSTNKLVRVADRLLYRFPRKLISRYYLKKIKPKICILSFPIDLLCLKKINTKKILVQHTSFDVYFERYYQNNKKLLEMSKEKLDCFVVLSKQDKIKLIEKFNFPKEKIRVIRHSCEVELLNQTKEKSKNLIIIGRLTASKRIDLAIEAMKNLSDFNLKIYGGGSEEEILELKKIIKDGSIQNVKLCGPTNQVQKVLDENGIFIMTSDYEGYPITTIEAMRRGLPIILRNTFVAANDVVKDNGILLEKEWNEDKFCEAVRRIYDNYEEYSKNAIEMGKRHNLDVIKKEWENLFKKLSGEKF